MAIPNPLLLNVSQRFNRYEELTKYSLLSTHTVWSTADASNSENIGSHDTFPNRVTTCFRQRGDRLYIRSWFLNRR